MVKNKKNIDLHKIKLIIWDLDNTFWNGTISEGPITPILDHIELVRRLSKRGFLNSICSKNDYDICRQELISQGIWEYFVFPSIDWNAKGQRISTIISEMKLREENVLFLDDEPYNLHQALNTCPKITCGNANDMIPTIKSLLKEFPEDTSMSRLKQYQSLQIKNEHRKKYSSDEAFLRLSEIKVSISYDTQKHIDRIVELIHRTNQLNFTKNRMSENEISDLISNNDIECGLVSVKDKYCDYGFVGFYAINKIKHRLIHFLFSCRTIGMGIEQFVYSELAYPHIEIVGDVVSSLDKISKPDWIQRVETPSFYNKTLINDDGVFKILAKGPCDVSQVIPYFANSPYFDTEFSYISRYKPGHYIESFNHTSQILTLSRLTPILKSEFIRELPFMDEAYFETTIFSKKYNYIILSLVTDYALGLYQYKRDPNIIVPLGQYTIDYTKYDNWFEIMKQQSSLSDQDIETCYNYFTSHFEFIGCIQEDILLRNLKEIRNKLDKDTWLLLLNGAERPFHGIEKKGYSNRHPRHIRLNQLVSSYVQKELPKTAIIDVNTCMDEEYPYLDTINHYKKNVYFKIAQQIQHFISQNDNKSDLKVKNRAELFLDFFMFHLSIIKGWIYTSFLKKQKQK